MRSEAPEWLSIRCLLFVPECLKVARNLPPETIWSQLQCNDASDCVVAYHIKDDVGGCWKENKVRRLEVR